MGTVRVLGVAAVLGLAAVSCSSDDGETARTGPEQTSTTTAAEDGYLTPREMAGVEYMAALEEAGFGQAAVRAFNSDEEATRFVTYFCAGYERLGDQFLVEYVDIDNRESMDPFITEEHTVLATLDYCDDGTITIPPPGVWTYPNIFGDPVTINEVWSGTYFTDGRPRPVVQLDRVLATEGCAALEEWQRAWVSGRVWSGEGGPTLDRPEGLPEGWVQADWRSNEYGVYARYASDIGRQAGCDWATGTP